MTVIEDLVERISSISPRNGTFALVAVDGRGGSGKTTLAEELGRRLPGFLVVHGDDYWEPSDDSEFGWFNEERFRLDVVAPLAAGHRHLTYRPYDWAVEPHVREVGLAVGDGVIVERCYAMSLGLAWDLRVWVEGSPELSLARGIDRNPAQARVWADTWRPREDRYLARYDPRARADVVVDGAAPFD